MLYSEYLKCAEKHLKGCTSMLLSYKVDNKTDWRVWLELYYLSGYIMEGITVYLAYKIKDWPEYDDIQRKYNMDFTADTGLDYYYDRMYDHHSVFPMRHSQQDRQTLLSVQGHNYRSIVERVLRNEPSFNETPYIGNGSIDPDVKALIDDWKPDIRYCYNESLIRLNQDIIARLFNTCFTIYKQIPTLI